MPERYNNKFTKFLNGKGFYAVLALCLAGAGTAAYIAMETAANRAEQQKQQIVKPSQSVSSQWTFPQSEETAKEQHGVRISSSQPSSSSSKQQSSPSQPAAPSKDSEQPAEQASLLKSSWTMPIEGETFTPYSNGELVKSETLGDWRTHNGVDIAAEKGKSVAAAAKGEVEEVYEDPLWGFVVEIEHPGDITARYCGLDKNVTVKEGDKVKQGQMIGAVGYIPAESAMPDHLHFECLKDEKYIDPLSLMN